MSIEKVIIRNGFLDDQCRRHLDVIRVIHCLKAEEEEAEEEKLLNLSVPFL